MRIFKKSEASWIEPPGHFGHLKTTDIMSRDDRVNTSVQLSLAPPGAGGESHYHEDDVQVFVVLSGTLTFDTDEGKFTLGPNEAVIFEPRERHATLNEGEEDSLSMVITVKVPKG